MSFPPQMTTLSQVLEKLRQHNMDNEFVLTKNGLTANQQKFYRPEDLVISRTFRFEGMSDPDDMAVLYIIQAADGATGYSVAPYGFYGNEGNEADYNNFIRQIPIENRPDQVLFSL